MVVEKDKNWVEFSELELNDDNEKTSKYKIHIFNFDKLSYIGFAE